MKKLLILPLFFCLNAHATVGITCTSKTGKTKVTVVFGSGGYGQITSAILPKTYSKLNSSNEPTPSGAVDNVVVTPNLQNRPIIAASRFKEEQYFSIFIQGDKALLRVADDSTGKTQTLKLTCEES
jgi:hypothetical protein